MKRRLGVYVGRFSPWHKGHQQVVLEALEHCEHVLILIGSPYSTDKIKNPWDYNFRKQMIEMDLLIALKDTSLYTVKCIDDYFTMPPFIRDVQSLVNKHFNIVPTTIGNGLDVPAMSSLLSKLNRDEVYLLGYEKDQSSYYLNKFIWKRLDTDFHGKISATDIRNEFFVHGDIIDNRQSISPSVYNNLMSWRANNLAEYNNVIEEYRFKIRHDAAWADSPYPPIFVTADALVVQHGHILLIRRKHAPGKGTWALPGGYIKTDESLEDAAIRELVEETELKLPKSVLRKSITKTLVVETPGRSSRGRIITNVVLIELRDDVSKLPRVKGQDDAEKAKWFSFADFNLFIQNNMFEDHALIIKHMLHL